MHAPPPQAALNAATGIVVGADSVDSAALPQSTWNFHRCRLLVPKFMRYSGDPAAGGVVPSRSAGSTPPYAVDIWKHCCVAWPPASIVARSQAQTFEPANVCPFVNMLYVV